ncbi:MAG: TfoX/Sxy family protein [Chloroflexi bacterium]|nr:TfoX/Sxy family protein [Chloroflexota bacterium]
MATTPEYRDYIVDLLTPYYPVTTRNMFGGVGIFCEDGMFGLITAEDVFYLKVDDENRADYKAADMPQFMNMPYYQAPGNVLDSTENLGVWVQKSLEVAHRSPKKKKKK